MAKVVFKIGDDVSTDTIYPGRFTRVRQLLDRRWHRTIDTAEGCG